MSIYKRFPSGYHQMPNRTSQDHQLTFEALGLIAYIDSKSESWIPRMEDMRKAHPRTKPDGEQAPIGKDKMQRIVKELAKAGYANLVRGANTKWEICNVPIWRFQDHLDIEGVFNMVETGELDSLHDFWGAGFTAAVFSGSRETRQHTIVKSNTKGKSVTSSFFNKKRSKKTNPMDSDADQVADGVEDGWSGPQVAESMVRLADQAREAEELKAETDSTTLHGSLPIPPTPPVAAAPPSPDQPLDHEEATGSGITPDVAHVEPGENISPQIEAMGLVPEGVKEKAVPWQAKWIADNYQPDWADVVGLMRKAPMGADSWKKVWNHPLFYHSRSSPDELMLKALIVRAVNEGVGNRRKCITLMRHVVDSTWALMRENGAVPAEWMRLMSGRQVGSNQFVSSWNEWCESRKTGQNRSSPGWAKSQLSSLDQVGINEQIELLKKGIMGGWRAIDPNKFHSPNHIINQHGDGRKKPGDPGDYDYQGKPDDAPRRPPHLRKRSG